MRTGPFSSLFKRKSRAKIVGELLIAYGEIEFDTLCCLAETLGSMSQALQVMFRIRSETSRLKVADAIMRPRFHALNIKEYDRFIQGAIHCASIRNFYAHCHWNNNGPRLVATNFEDFAKPLSTPANLKTYLVSLDLLRQQQAFFKYVQEGLWHLLAEHQKKNGKPPDHDVQAPKTVPTPLIHIGLGKQVNRNRAKSRPKGSKGKRQASSMDAH